MYIRTFFFCLAVCAYGSNEGLIQEEFAPVDGQGFLSLNQFIATVKASDGTADFTVSFDFSSKSNSPSPYLGAGWKCRLLEAHCYPMREDLYQVNLVCGRNFYCGKTIYLLRQKENPAKYQSLDREWTGELKEDVFQLFGKDGSFILYRKGQLAEVGTSDGRIVRWIRENGKVKEIRDGEKTLLSVEWDPQTNLAKSFLVNDLKYAFEYSPIGSGKDSPYTLSRVTWPDATKESYSVEKTKTESSLSIKSRDGQEKHYSWSLETGKLVSDDNGRYVIGGSDGVYERPQITKIGKDGKTSSFYDNTRKGVSTHQSEDGVITREYFIQTKGKNYQKLYKIEREVAGKKEVVVKLDFNEEGQMVKRTQDGVLTEYAYDKFGNRFEIGRKGDFSSDKAAQLKAREIELLQGVERASNESLKSEARLKLGLFYIHDTKEFEKAEAMVTEMPADQLKFNIMVHSIFYDERLLPDQKRLKCERLLLEFPDEETLLSDLIQNYIKLAPLTPTK